MKKNKRKIITIIASFLIIVLVGISLIYFNTQENNVEIKSSLKEYNAELQENEHMHIEVDSSGDKLPVPNGYVGSKVAGENEIDTGYVIYEGEEEVNDINVEEAQKTRNQYVWIPVPDASTMYGTDENGKKWGKLYDFTTDTGDDIDSITGTKPLNWSENNGIIKILDKNKLREPDISMISENNIAYDIDSRLKSLEIEVKNTHEFLIQLEKEFDNMIDSIEKYGGFYIGRYESSNISKDEIVIRKGKKACTEISWYEAYFRSKTLRHANCSIETGLIWGNQWNRILMWLIETENKTKEQIAQNSGSWGNYKDSTFEYIDEYGEIKIKNENVTAEIPTGSSEYTKANNIYDIAGNLTEWSMTTNRNGRTTNSGSCYNTSSYDVNHKSQYGPISSQTAISFRAMLYIK